MDPSLGRPNNLTARRHRRIRFSGTAACLAVAALAASVALAVHPAVLPTRADRVVQTLLERAPVSQEDQARSRELTLASLSRRPLDGAALLRLAYLSTLVNGRLDQDGNLALERSYDVEPLGSEITFWRLAFVLDHWSSASPTVRAAAYAEFEAVYPRRSWDLDALARTARDPQGRMVAGIASRRLRRMRDSAASPAG